MPDYIGRYKAERIVGSGAFATVWLAHDETLDAPVAIKVLAENWAHDPEVHQRFLEEARILWRADSDHIVRIHNVDELPDGRPYFVMDYADRGTLQQRIAGRADAGRSWSFDEAIEISLAIADGLKVAHALGIVHRDLKPANIMLQSVPAHHGETRDEKLILTDFGMAKSLARSRGTTIATGTPHYMAPEQIDGRADERSDVYAAGVVLYELLAGRVPYPYDTPGQLFVAHAAGPPTPIGELRPDVPTALAEVLERAIAPTPAERWPSAEAWAAALTAAQEGKHPATTPFVGVPSNMQRTLAPEEVAAAKPAPPPVNLGTSDAEPPPPPAAPPPAATSADGRRRRRRGLTIGLPVAGILIAVAAATILLVTSGTKNADAGTLTLMPATSVGLNPFTRSIVPRTPSDATITPNPKLPAPLKGQNIDSLVNRVLAGLNGAPGSPSTLKLPHLKLPSVPSGRLPTVSGAAYGLYGGTQLLSVCDEKKLIRFLTANPAKARAWAAVQGITTADIPSYVSRLTDVVLQTDTRVTNHGFVNGTADPIDEILQAGTAVLVDAHGVPRARCYCGNPLTPPRTTATNVKLKGTPWAGFTIKHVVVIEPPTKPLRVLPMTEVLTGITFILRPVGSPAAAASIVDQTGTTPAQTTPPTTTSPTTTSSPATTTTATTTTSTTSTTTATPPTTTAPTTTAPSPTTTAATTTAATTTAPPAQLTNITSDGTPAASSTFSSQYPVSNATDGNVTTSWFSIGDKEGPNSWFDWTSSSGAHYIGGIEIVSNAQNAIASDRHGFGFSSVKIDVLKNGHVVWTGTGQRPGDQNITVYPKVDGDSIHLTLIHHESPACGGFAELRVIGAT